MLWEAAKRQASSEYPAFLKSKGHDGFIDAAYADGKIGEIVAYDKNTVTIEPNLSSKTPQKTGQTSSTPKPVETPPRPVQTQETASVKEPQATGIANQVQDREALSGLINTVEKTKGKGAENWQKVGKEAVDAGEYDPEALAKRIADGEESPDAKKFGVLLEGKRRLQNALNAAKPGEEYNKALANLDEYLANVQQGKGQWADMGRALQAGTELDTGNFAQVIERVQKQGGKLNPKMEQQFRDMTEKIKTAESKLAETERLLKEEQAKRTTASQAKKGPRFSKEALDAELDDLLKEFGAKASKLSAGVDPELLPIMGKIAVNYMKRGVNTLDDVVKAVQSHFKDASYEDILDGIDAATKGTSRTRSELQKEMASLKSQAKSDVGARKRIADLRNQLETGDFVIPTKREKVINNRLQSLRDERDLLSSEVRARIASVSPSNDPLIVRAINAPKTLKSSIDISAPGRQGWLLALTNPDKVPTAFWSQLQSLANPKRAIRLQNEILNRENASLYKRMKLYLGPLDGQAGEEVFSAQLFPQWRKFNPFRGSERAYTAYLNRIRADVADRLIKWAGPNATDKDLEVIGNYINVASGRGGKSIPGFDKAAEALNLSMFSGRFVASRLEYTALQPIFRKTGGPLTSSIRGRALVASEYARAIGALGVVYTIAKLAGAETSADRASSDFGKIKIGDTRIDPLAGLQQGAVLLHRMATGEYTTAKGEKIDLNNPKYGGMDKEDVAKRFVRSKLSPTFGTAWSLITGKNYIGEEYNAKEAAKDLILPISLNELVEGARKDGWDKDDFLGLLNFLGFNTSTYSTTEKRNDPRG
jgi:hypothetical protein